MKQLTIVLTAVLLLVAAALAEERATVFRGLAWGDPPEALGDAYVLDGDGPIVHMARVKENMQLGSVTALSIRYSFFRDQLYAIMVVTADSQGLERLVRARYGSPTMNMPNGYIWRFPESDTVVIFTTVAGGSGMVLLCESIYEQVQNWETLKTAVEAQTAW